MKRLNHLLLILIAMITMGCGDNAGEKQQELEIQALNQAISQATNNASSIQEVAAQLPGECVGTIVENTTTMTIVKCLIEGVFTTYLIDEEVGVEAFTLLDQALSCTLADSEPVTEDITLMLFSNESFIADLSVGTTPRFVLVQSTADITNFGIPCSPFFDQGRP